MATELLSPDYSQFNHAHTGAITAKTWLIINGRVCLALNTSGANAENVWVYQSERVRVPKATGEVWAPGEKVYYDPVAAKFTKTSTNNTLAGMAQAAAVSGATEGKIHLTPATLA